MAVALTGIAVAASYVCQVITLVVYYDRRLPNPTDFVAVILSEQSPALFFMGLIPGVFVAVPYLLLARCGRHLLKHVAPLLIVAGLVALFLPEAMGSGEGQPWAEIFLLGWGSLCAGLWAGLTVVESGWRRLAAHRGAIHDGDVSMTA